MTMSFVESPAAHRRAFAGTIGLLTMLALVGSGVEDASARPVQISDGAAAAAVRADAPSPVPDAVQDTVPIRTPRLFGGRLLSAPRYLARVVRSVTLPSAEEIATEIAVERDASSYAERYGISKLLAGQIVTAALGEGIDPELAFRLVRVESVFQVNARGPSGALGLTQLMPSTARALNRALRSEAQILDPETNLRTGFRYLRAMIERFDGDVRLGVLAYNRGETAVNRALRSGRDPENGYSKKVLGSAASRYLGKGTVPSNE